MTTDRLALAAHDQAAALRVNDGRTVDPLALLLAIHDARTQVELAAARLAAIRAIGAIGGYAWPDERDHGCRVTTGPDALALGCLVDREPENPDDPHGPGLGRLIHAAHEPYVFHRRIAHLTARAESRLDPDTIPAEILEQHPTGTLDADTVLDAILELDTHDHLAALAADAHQPAEQQHREIDLRDGDR